MADNSLFFGRGWDYRPKETTSIDSAESNSVSARKSELTSAPPLFSPIGGVQGQRAV